MAQNPDNNSNSRNLTLEELNCIYIGRRDAAIQESLVLEVTNLIKHISSTHPGATLERLEMNEKMVVDLLNSWIAFVSSRKSPNIVVRFVMGGQWQYQFVSEAELKQILLSCKMTTFDPKDVENIGMHTKALRHGTRHTDSGDTLLYTMGPAIKFAKGSADEPGNIGGARDANFDPLAPIVEEQEDKPCTAIIRVIKRNVVDVWMDHPDRKVYTNVVFNPTPSHLPGHATDSELNTWCGFRLQRDNVQQFRNWNLLGPILNHIRWTFCDNEAEYVDFLSRLALLIQRPWIKPAVAFAVGGIEGSGKSIFWAEIMGRIIGPAHFVHIQSMLDVVGEFNAPLTDKVLVVVDETYFKGDQEKAYVKNLISGEVNRKRLMRENTEMQKSYCTVVFLGNIINRLVPASKEARRFAAFFSSLLPVLEHPYFRDQLNLDPKNYGLWLLNEMTAEDEEGLKTFANFLYNLPLKNFNYSNVPETKLLLVNKMASMEEPQKWWVNCLHNKCNTSDNTWQSVLQVEYLYNMFLSNNTWRPEAPKQAKWVNQRRDWSMEDWLSCMRDMWPPTHTIMAGPHSSRMVTGMSRKQCVDHLMQTMAGFKFLVQDVKKTIVGLGAETTSSFVVEAPDATALVKGRRDVISKVPAEVFMYNFMPQFFHGEPVAERIAHNSFRILNSEQWKDAQLDSTPLNAMKQGYTVRGRKDLINCQKYDPNLFGIEDTNVIDVPPPSDQM